MKHILTFTGRPALTLGSASNRQPEILRGDSWQTASGLPEATRCLHDDPSAVRLVAPARVLVEDVLKVAIAPGRDLVEAVTAARQGALTAEQAAALDIIETAMNATEPEIAP